jgi:hypothetical protein
MGQCLKKEEEEEEPYEESDEIDGDNINKTEPENMMKYTRLAK